MLWKTFIAVPLHTALLWFFHLTASHTRTRTHTCKRLRNLFTKQCKAFIIYIQRALNTEQKHIITSFIFLREHVSAWKKKKSKHWLT